MKVLKRDNKGITLIVLVITIIVLLILTTAIIQAMNGKGIIDKAKEAINKWNIENEREVLQLNVEAYFISRYNNNDEKKLGEELYDKGLYNGEKWNMVFAKKKNYGTGWNYVGSGTKIGEYGKTRYNWVVNYETGEIEYLEKGTYHKLDYTDSMAVTTDIALNIDATNLSDESSWENVENYGKETDGTGGVTYDEENMALVFDGKDDYLKLTKPGDFSDGFTFEMYMNLDRLCYNNGSKWDAAGFFCKMPTLSSNLLHSMRFGFAPPSSDNPDYMNAAKFYEKSDWVGDGFRLRTDYLGTVLAPASLEDSYINCEKYITIVYYRYEKSKPQDESISSFMENCKCDVLAYYFDGKLYGYTGYGKTSYDKGYAIWGGDNIPMFIGVCPWGEDSNLYYLKGKVYTVRLYTRPLSSDEVWNNYDTTLSYRDALKELMG